MRKRRGAYNKNNETDAVKYSRKNFLIVISAPSGGGKTTICRAILERMPDIVYSISYTTRQPRRDEEDGKSYFFISEEQFKKKINCGDLLEYAQVHNNWYGTSRSFILDKFNENRNVIMDIDIQGAAEIIESKIDCVTIFLLPPDLDTLKERLQQRGTDSAATINLRLQNALKEIKNIDKYQYLVINNELDKAINEVESIITAEKNKVQRYIFNSQSLELSK